MIKSFVGDDKGERMTIVAFGHDYTDRPLYCINNTFLVNKPKRLLCLSLEKIEIKDHFAFVDDEVI